MSNVENEWIHVYSIEWAEVDDGRGPVEQHYTPPSLDFKSKNFRICACIVYTCDMRIYVAYWYVGDLVVACRVESYQIDSLAGNRGLTRNSVSETGKNGKEKRNASGIQKAREKRRTNNNKEKSAEEIENIANMLASHFLLHRTLMG